MKKTTIVLAAVIMILVALPGIAQEARRIEQLSDSPTVPQFEQDIAVRLRLVDVTATDSSGKYVTDLKADEFKVFVNGREVQVRTFDSYFPGATVGIAEGQPVEAEMPAAGVPRASMPERRIVLFFDQSYSSFRGLKNAKEAAIEFVRRSLSPGDQVMVVAYDMSLKVHQVFTHDRDAVAMAIERIKFGFSNNPSGGAAFRGENPHNIRIYLQALQKLALYLESFRGRKTFVMLSEGFDERIARYSIPQYMRETYEAFNDANCTIFSLDVRGLYAGGSGGSAFVDINRSRARHDTLSIFAVETGGTFFRGSNDIEELLLRIDDDISHYYVLGFYIEEEHDGRFREVKIETTRPGVRLRYRDGYFAPKPFDKLNKDERTVNLEEGFNRNSPSSDMDAKFAVNIYPRSDGSAVGTVSVEAVIDGELAPEYEMLGFIHNNEDELLDAFHKVFTFSSMPEVKVFRHTEPVLLQPGENVIRVVLRDNRDGRRAYDFLLARMPELGDSFYASTIAFAAPREEVVSASGASVRSLKNQYRVAQQEIADPLSPISRLGLEPGVTSEIERSSDATVILRVVGMGDSDGPPQLAATYNLRTSDGTSINLKERDFSVYPVTGANAAIIVSKLDLRDVPAGEYTMLARIDDAAAGKTVGQRAQVILR